MLVGLLGCESPRRGRPGAPSSRQEAEAATRAEDWEKAAERWHGVYLSEEPRPVDACVHAARALLQLGDAESAAHLVDLGLTENPDNAELLALKGRALVALGFRRAAEDCYERALEIEPGFVDALVALGHVRIELGLETAAVKPLQRAVEISGGDFATWRLLARALRESGRAHGAYLAWVEAFERGPGEVDDLVEAATLHLDPTFRRSHPEATEVMHGWLRKAIELDPQCTRAHFQLGVLSEQLGRHDEAVEHYRRAVEVDPGCLMALTNLAILYADDGDEVNAREMVDRALALEQDGSRRRALQRLLEPFRR